MNITRCLHVALLVSDLERSQHFYESVLELEKIDRDLRFPGAWYEVAGFQIHLMVASNSQGGLDNPEKWGRNRHIAFSVASLEAAKERLLAHNCPLQMSASGRAALFTQDPDGNVIELGEL
ncbi:VOC family protein [Leptolyngbya sp. FACHB-321]|uniref:VOC family protein n=1 Tax=Leptolyngbya sp. FACHB-321 TaxID=2692807 RepID=UPI001686ACB8|nr:VOC family protein [Leptolyngbya sp. FACHB-321]MBD2036751.1 VOC family protein [Leptolyngbya sp. FACHB-321]